MNRAQLGCVLSNEIALSILQDRHPTLSGELEQRKGSPPKPTGHDTKRDKA